MSFSSSAESEKSPLELTSIGPADAEKCQTTIPHMKPADGGPAAWRILTAAVILESLLWGFPLSFGVFQNYYARLPQFEQNPYIAVVGTVATGICYLGAPAVVLLMNWFPGWERVWIWVGWPLCLGGLVAGSFATTLTALILTQGVMYGTGFVLFYYPTIHFVNEYWIERRGFAFGTMCASSALAGIVFPFTLEVLLCRYGYPVTLRVLALSLGILTAPVMPLLIPRGSTSEYHSATAPNEWQCLKNANFWVFSIANAIQNFGYFFPGLFLPSIAASVDHSAAEGALLVAILSIAQALGQFGFGYASDRKVSLNILIWTSCICSGAAVVFYYLAPKTMPCLIIFSLTYGFFAGAWISLWSQMGTTIYDGKPPNTLVSLSLLCFGAGIGNIAAGPISWIFMILRWDRPGAHKYDLVMLFTGLCMTFSGGVVLVVQLWRGAKARRAKGTYYWLCL
ncbi:MFS general substrate transporter [Venturia nashicola]|uniref:MFS general substrate transporter n=1 Tax=Venturia nashicola TaxID=86259 RepID=A0A4Z1NWE4_9PEZI|nr:MFS general substrate transporter [Venturia nashicola]